jgi:magnesium-transporting ATPase (P-type)
MNYQTKFAISFYGLIALIGFIFSILFYTLVPGTLLTLPKNGTKNVVNATHTGLFIGIVVLLIVIFSRSIKHIRTRDIIPLLYLFALFYALLPGVFITVPKDSSEKTINAMHSSIFGIIIAISLVIYFEKYGF